MAKALVPVDSIAKCADEFVQIQQVRSGVRRRHAYAGIV